MHKLLLRVQEIRKELLQYQEKIVQQIIIEIYHQSHQPKGLEIRVKP